MLFRLLSAVLPTLALAACVTTNGTPTVSGSPDPVAARLSSDGLSVRLSNGATCRGGKPPEGARRWKGVLGGCPDGWTYVVLLDERTNPARFIVEAVLTTLTIEDALAPVGEVLVTDASGRTTVFASPPGD